MFAGIFPGRGPWITVLATCVVIAVWVGADGRIAFDLRSGVAPAAVVLWSFALGSCIALRSPETSIRRFLNLVRHFMHGLAFVVLGFLTLRVLSHLLMTLPFEWADDRLAGWDSSFGLSWMAYAHWVAERPTVVRLFDYAYFGTSFMSAAIFMLLFLLGRAERAKEFLELLLYSGLACMIIAACFPAKAAVAHFADPALQTAFGPAAGVYHLKMLEALRSGEAHMLVLYQMPGLATFPSFHTIVGLLVVYACRGMIPLFVPAVIYTTVIVASTPIMGGHYLVDIAGGIALAVTVIVLHRNSDLVAARARAILNAIKQRPRLTSDARPAAPKSSAAFD